MALQIGFANKFYTLWDVTAGIEYGQASHGEIYSYETVSYTFIQNLSIDVESAVSKALEKGCNDLEPNHDLFGRNKSWIKRNRKNYCEFYNNTTPYNPETGESFSKLDKEGVLRFFKDYYYSDNCHVINRGVALGVISLVDGQYMTQEEASRYQDRLDLESKYAQMEANGDTMIINVVPTRNLSVGDLYAYLKTEDHGYIYFKDYKTMIYSGFKYGLPTDEKGKGKKIKGCNLDLVVSPVKINGAYELLVQSFKIIK